MSGNKKWELSSSSSLAGVFGPDSMYVSKKNTIESDVNQDITN